MTCVSGLAPVTIASLKAGGVPMVARKAGAPPLRALDSSPAEEKDTFILNPPGDGDCGGHLLKAYMLAVGSQSTDARKKLFEIVKRDGVFHGKRLEEYREALMPTHGHRFLEDWEVLLVCKELHLNPILLAMSTQRGRANTHQYTALLPRFEADMQHKWPQVVILMTNNGEHFEGLTRRLSTGGKAEAKYCLTFPPDTFKAPGGSRASLKYMVETQAPAMDMRLAAILNDHWVDLGTHEVLDTPGTRQIVSLTTKGKQQLTEFLGSAGHPLGARRGETSDRRKRPTSPDPTNSSGSKASGKRPLSHMGMDPSSRPRPPSPRFEEDDPELAAAIALSLGTTGATRPPTPSRQDSMNEEERRQLDLAIQRSLYGSGILYRCRGVIHR